MVNRCILSTSHSLNSQSLPSGSSNFRMELHNMSRSNPEPPGSPSAYPEISHSVAHEHDMFVQSFEDWIARFGTSQASVMANTFVDDNGIYRHKDSWVECDSFDQRKLESETGCVNITITKPGVKATAQNTFVVNFLTNFRTNWHYFESSPIDELSRYAPLFKLYISLFCHKRTSQLIVCLSAYFLACQITTDVVHPLFPLVVRLMNYLMTVLQVGVYLALVVLFRGSMFPDEIDAVPPPPSSNKKEKNPGLNQLQKDLGCFHYLKEALFKSSAEAQRLYEYKRHARTSHSAAESQVPFYSALNIALKFLTKHGAHKNGSVKLDTPRHNIKLLFIFFLVPLYMILASYASPLGPMQALIKICHDNGVDSAICKYYESIFYLSLCYLVPVVIKVIFACTVLLAMVGLALGAEVGRGLVDCWINRFGCLRILDADGNNSREGHDEASAGDPLSPHRTSSATATPDVENGRLRTSSAVVNAMHQRSTSVARSSVSLEARSPRKGELAVTVHGALEYVQRDAFETYLFLREFMSTCSKAWSFTILLFAFLAVFFIFIFLLGSIANAKFTSDIEWAYYTIWTTIRVVSLIVYPITSLAHANVYVYALEEQFLVAAPEDFAVIGGRDSWLDYLQKVPAMWMIYGFAISWDRLAGLLWTGVAGIGALTLSTAF